MTVVLFSFFLSFFFVVVVENIKLKAMMYAAVHCAVSNENAVMPVTNFEQSYL